MPGERYFAARDRLLGCCGRIEALLDEVGSDDPDRKPDADEAGLLARPVRLVVLGEINAGKTSLLNALAGQELGETGPLPRTRDLVVYRRAAGERAARLPAGWREVDHPAPLLRHFEMVDTPGSNGPQRDAVTAALADLATADLLMIVFPAGNTWTAATWDLVSQLPDEALGRSVLVVQQADQKAERDLQVIRGHMADLSVKKVGRALPIFAVAAELAARGGRDPGFEALRRHIDRGVCHSPEREHQLRRTAQQAHRTLREIEGELDRQRRGMDDDAWFLGNLEREGERLRDLVLEHSPKTLAGARGRYEGEVANLCRALHRALGAAPTVWRLFAGDRTAARLEARFAEQLQQAIRDFADQDFARLLEECEGHWGEVRPRVRERIGTDPGPADIAGPGREAAGELFASGVGRAVPKALGQLRVRAGLDDPLRRRNAQLKLGMGLLLAALTVAGLCGTFGFPRVATGALGFAGLTAGIGLIALWWTRSQVVSLLRQQLLDSRGRFESALREDYAGSVRELFHEYSNGLLGVRRQLADRKARLAPRSAQWDRLYLELKTIEQDFD